MLPTFEDILGQPKIIDYLKSNIKAGTLPHALMFIDKDGGEGLPLAMATAKYLHRFSIAQQYDAGAERNEATRRIEKQLDAMAHPDLSWLYPVAKKDKLETADDFLPLFRELIGENSRPRYRDWLNMLSLGNTQLSIAAREADLLESKLSHKPYESDYIVVICWLPEKMHQACANKLLKLIEEPPTGVQFLFVSQAPELLLPTISSRVQQIRVAPISKKAMAENLDDNFRLTKAQAERYAHLSKGNLAVAERLAKEGEKSPEVIHKAFDVLLAPAKGNPKQMKEIAEELHLQPREYLTSLCKTITSIVRDAFMYRLVEDHHSPLIYTYEDHFEDIEKLSLLIREDNIEKILGELDDAMIELQQNVSTKMVFFDIFLKFASWYIKVQK